MPYRGRFLAVRHLQPRGAGIRLLDTYAIWMASSVRVWQARLHLIWWPQSATNASAAPLHLPHTLVERHSWAPSNDGTQDGKPGITIQDPPPESGRRTHLLYFTYSYCILSCVWKLATSLLVSRHYEHLLLFSMMILHVTSSQFCLYLLNTYHFTYTFSHARTEAHTHKHTCTINTQEELRQPGTGAWLRGAEERLC